MENKESSNSPILKKVLFTVTVLAAVGGLSFLILSNRTPLRLLEEPRPAANGEEPTLPAQNHQKDQENIKLIATELNIPWEIEFLPDGDLLITERTGTLLKISENQTKVPIQGIAHKGEGGLLGLTLHPNYEENSLFYLYLTTEGEGSGLENRVDQYRLENDEIERVATIIGGIPGAINHNGGRLKFGPDSKLYISTGDAGNVNLAQDLNSLAGKILRINPDGSIPEDNPFDNAVWTYGHRNPQGLAWDDQNRLWATEHGPSGLDEINLIERGQNYGWPEIRGDQTQEGMETPIINSGRVTTWAPAGVAYFEGSLFFGGLRGSALYQAPLIGTEINNIITHFKNDLGRVRAVTLGPDNFLYLSTSNTDGRGNPKATDDKIIRINPETLSNN